MQEEAENHQLSVLRNAFHESPTRNAFSSFAAQMHGMNRLMESTSAKLSVLTRQTEPLSPSRSTSQPNFPTSSHPPSSSGLPPHRLFPSCPPALSPRQCTSAAHTPTATPIPSSPPPTPGTSSSPQSSSPAPLSPSKSKSRPGHSGEIAMSNGCQVHPPTSEFVPQQPSNTLNPATMTSTSNQHVYHILPLTPFAPHGQPVRTPHDLILPPATAFSSSAYPIFTTSDCTWQYILDRVVNPSTLWSSYAPGSLGEYPDVKSIWQAWDEGAYIKGVGCKPAVRLVDVRWGNLESQETGKRKYSSWRPRNDNKVWAYPMFSAGKTHCSPNRPARRGPTFTSSSIALTRGSNPDRAPPKRSSTLRSCVG